ncbi:MAG: macro domain-containing protein, partial [Candidatus Hodarchaeales archaeon]
IHRAGGSEILEECKIIRQTMYPGGLPPGEAVVTTAGKMAAKYVIHTVGPIWQGGNAGEAEILMRCYLNSLKAAENKNCKSIAFPAISTGAYGFPKDKASKVVSNALLDYYSSAKTPLDRIHLIFFSKEDLRLFNENCQLDKT